MKLTLLAVLFGLALAALPAASSADGGWLDSPTSYWNAARMGIPAAPRAAGISPYSQSPCTRDQRAPQTKEEAAVAAAGWTLFNEPKTSGTTQVVSALSSYDGMCRPFGYQIFVFADGVFAGTLSPAPMDSRFDGAVVPVRLESPDRITADFLRYVDADPLCCPSRISKATFVVNHNALGPVVTLSSVRTGPPTD